MQMDHEVLISLDEEDIQSLHEVFHAIQVTLDPMTHRLTPDFRQKLPLIDDETIRLLEDTWSQIPWQSHDLKTLADLNTLKENMEAINQLLPLLRKIELLGQDLRDTIQFFGSKALSEAKKHFEYSHRKHKLHSE